MDYRAALVDFYRKHNPLKLVEVDALLRKYRGREEELLQALRVKYKVNERDEPVEEPVVPKPEQPAETTPPPPPPPAQEPPRMEAVKNDPPPLRTQRVTYSDTDITRSGDNKGRTAAERAEYWRKELERREMERAKGSVEKRTEPKVSPKTERMKVVREPETDSGEEAAAKKPLNLKLIIGIAAAVILLVSTLWILLNDNLRTSIGAKLGFGSEEAKTEEKMKKEGLDPGVLGSADDSAKKTGDFALEEEEPEEKAPSVEDAMNEQPSSVAKPAPKQPESTTDDSAPAGEIQRKKYYIGYAAVASEATAKTMAAELRRKGFDSATYFYIPDYDPGGKNLYRICVGPFSTLEQAEEMAVNVRSENPSAYSFYLK